MPQFHILKTGSNLLQSVQQLSQMAGLPQRAGRKVFIKPNFTYPFFKPGVTTTREMLEAVIITLKDIGCTTITLGEGDGGYKAFDMDKTFENYRLGDLARRYGVEVVNVSRWPSLTVEVEARKRTFSARFPRPIFEDFDSFITIPVPKVHAMTVISNALKNQWGLIQEQMRLYFHCAFNEIITEVNRRLPNPFAIVDGQFGLTRNGPMIEGVTLELGWAAISDNLWLNDRMICALMKIPEARVEHLQFAQARGLVPEIAQCQISPDWREFVDDRFYLRRNAWNRLAKLTWHWPAFNHFVYFSKWSGILHKIMYSVRHKPRELSARGVDW
jgi:uncharacterized protein (DUF362 family)